MRRESKSQLIICILLVLGVSSVSAGEGDQRDRTLRVMTRNMVLSSDFAYILEALATHPNDCTGLIISGPYDNC